MMAISMDNELYGSNYKKGDFTNYTDVSVWRFTSLLPFLAYKVGSVGDDGSVVSTTASFVSPRRMCRPSLLSPANTPLRQGYTFQQQDVYGSLQPPERDGRRSKRERNEQGAGNVRLYSPCSYPLN